MTMHHENAKVFTALCDVTRLRILEYLRNGEGHATCLQEHLNMGQSTLSHHIKILMEGGILTARKKGKWTYYSINESGSRYAAGLLKLLTTKNIAQQGKRRVNMKKPFTIVVDTGCDLPAEYMKEYGIDAIPISFMLNNVIHDKGGWQDISGKDFYKMLRSGGVSKTSLINPETFVESFTEHAKQGRDVLYIILSSALSGTYQSALIALDEVKAIYPDCNIHLVDSIGATGLNGLLAMLAVQKRNEGSSVEETAAWLEQRKHYIHGFITVDDLMYLHRGGRLGKLSAVGGSLLGIKPLLNVKPDGSLALKEKIRGRVPALKLIAKQLTRTLNPDTILETAYVIHTDCEPDAKKLVELVKQTVNVRRVETFLMGPVVGSHVGPGAVALIFEGDKAREEYEGAFYA
jgi:DegV family protein with EDD domain